MIVVARGTSPASQTFTPGASSSRYSDRGSHPGTYGSSYSGDRRGDFRSGGFSRYDDSSDGDYYSSHHLSRDYYVDDRCGEPRKYADPKNSGRSRSRSSSPTECPRYGRHWRYFRCCHRFCFANRTRCARCAGAHRARLRLLDCRGRAVR